MWNEIVSLDVADKVERAIQYQQRAADEWRQLGEMLAPLWSAHYPDARCPYTEMAERLQPDDETTRRLMAEVASIRHRVAKETQ